MKISVAIATYNRASMAVQAVEAALAQNPHEVVISDDASPDGTWELLASRAATEPKLRVLRRSRNSGGVDNWNDAMRATRGDYIAWCSDDDRFLPGHLAASVAYLEEHPDVGLVHSGFVDAVETASSREWMPRPFRFPGAYVLRPAGLIWYLLRYYDWPFHPSTLVMRREVWTNVGPFDPQYALADTDWFVRAGERYSIAMLARHGVLNRRHAGNWSNRLGSVRMQSEIRDIVGRSIARLYQGRTIARRSLMLLWRTNVRLRVALTLASRLRTGHGEAAADALRMLMAGLGLPNFAVAFLERALLRLARRRTPGFDDTRQSVSPL